VVRADQMPGTILNDAVEELLVESLRAWCARAEVQRQADGVLLVTAGRERLRVSRAPAELPFRWMVDDGARTRGATSIAGLLRSLRAIVDPDYRPVRLRIAPLPLLPP
jgi:hypothetical protein